jgi:hypothetical protein
MKKLALLGIAAVALAAAVPVHAEGLSLTGETGVARTPVAMALPPMSCAIAGDFVGSEDLFVPLRAEFGIIEGLELGLNYWYADTKDNQTQWGLNAKYVIPAEMMENVSVAAGFNYQSWSADGGRDYSVTKFYGVVSYVWETKVPIIPSGGLSYEVQGIDKDESGIRFFGSIVAKVMPNLAVGAEFNLANEDLDGDDADSSLWFGARFSPLENLTLQAGILNNANVGGTDESDFVLHGGVQYAFSFAN